MKSWQVRILHHGDAVPEGWTLGERLDDPTHHHRHGVIIAEDT